MIHRSRAVLVVCLGALVLSACASSTPSPTIDPTPTPSPVVTTEPTATPRPTPAPIPVDPALLDHRLTVLVIGSDSSQARRNGGLITWRTDSLMVVSVNGDHSQISMLSLPRDTVDVPLGDGRIYRGKVNEIAELFGIDRLRKAMSALLGVPIDRYLMIDMDDFGWIVDAVGGIDVEVKTRISDPKVHLRLDPGLVHLDGAKALAFSRSRADSDYARAARQQQVVLALLRSWVDPSTGGALVGGLRLLGSLETNIALTELPTLIEIGRRSLTAKVVSAVLAPPRFSYFVGIEPASNRGWVMIPNVAAMRSYARSLMGD
jgi:cell envelope-related function transcriptional attenuator common domain